MNYRFILPSLTRISTSGEQSFEVLPRARDQWANGDYVAAEITDRGSSITRIELPSGRMMEPMVGERIVGALGVRHATLENTGSWRAIDDTGAMHLLTAGGLCGRMTSQSIFSPSPIQLKYMGHVMLGGEKSTMQAQVQRVPEQPLQTPVVLLVGTSMSAGKTMTARIITRQLKLLGQRVLGVKMAGAGRYRDILTIKDAGADFILDFVDAGLPSTICNDQEYVEALKYMTSRMSAENADVAIVEIGASPLEPYNGALAIAHIMENVKSIVLCASDPYAVYGVIQGFGLTPDWVTGPATNTIAGAELVEKLCRVKARNLLEPENVAELAKMLRVKLGIA